MSEPYSELGGQPSSVPLPKVGARPNKPHPGPCNHPDSHVCPLANETTLDAYGYETTTLCDCTEETT